MNQAYDKMVFKVRVVMFVCSTFLLIPFIIELIKIKEAGEHMGIIKFYTKNKENIIDSIFYTTYVVYFIVRTWILPSDTMNSNPFDQEAQYMSNIAEVNLLTALIMILTVFRLFRFLTIYPKIS